MDGIAMVLIQDDGTRVCVIVVYVQVGTGAKGGMDGMGWEIVGMLEGEREGGKEVWRATVKVKVRAALLLQEGSTGVATAHG